MLLALSGLTWVYATFATASHVQAEIEDLKTMIRAKHEVALKHSDQNKEMVERSVGELKDSFGVIQQHLFQQAFEYQGGCE